jgi:hypothetical protein
MINYLRMITLLGLGLIFLTACEEEDVYEAENKLQANAGEDREVSINVEVGLDGSASKDGKGQPFNYQWTFKEKPDGSISSLQNANTDQPVFTPDQEGEYIVQLTISNASGEHQDEVSITATAVDLDAVILDQNIDADRVLADINPDPEAADYLVSSQIAVTARLGIEPGVKIAFEADKGMVIHPEGSLSALGTVSSPIVFTGKEAVKAYWKGITIISENPLNKLSYVQISYAGSSVMESLDQKAALGISDQPGKYGYVELKNSTISHSGGFGLLASQNTILQMEANTFRDCGFFPIGLPINQAHRLDVHTVIESPENHHYVVLSGDDFSPGTTVSWKPLGAYGSYYLKDNLQVNEGLYLEAGVRLRMGAGKYISINPAGFLNAQGTAELPVEFSALAETDLGPTPTVHWSGIMINSASDQNLLDYVNIINAGAGLLPSMTQQAALSLDETAKLVLRNSTVDYSQGVGIFLKESAKLTAFTNNTVAHAQGSALVLQPSQLAAISSQTFSMQNNAVNKIELKGGTLQNETLTSWPAYEYLVSGDIIVRTPLKLAPDTELSFVAKKMMSVENDAFLEATGVSFTGAEQQAGYWAGLVFSSPNPNNSLSDCNIAYAGSSFVAGLVSTKASIAVTEDGFLSIFNSHISHGEGWGIAADTEKGAIINQDVSTVNTFENLSEGNVRLVNGGAPTSEIPASLVGEWVNQWSLDMGYTVVEDYYDETNASWFKGAYDPWSMEPYPAYGLKIDEGGNFYWIVYASSGNGGCRSYSTEFVKGKVAVQDQQIIFKPSLRRKKYHSTCNPSLNFDEAQPLDHFTLGYSLSKTINNQQQEQWLIELINPDQSSFTFFKK